MNDKSLTNSPVDAKKTWTTPVVEMIDLNAAENTTTHTVTDGFPHKKS